MQRTDLELKMCDAFKVLIEKPEYGGRYHSLTPGHPDKITDDEYNTLVAKHIMFKVRFCVIYFSLQKIFFFTNYSLK